MRFQDTGAANQPSLLFIHGLSATAESCYGAVASGMEKQNSFFIWFSPFSRGFHSRVIFTNLLFFLVFILEMVNQVS